MARRRSLQASAVLVVMVAIALSGCQIPFGPQAHVHGTVYGEEISARESGKSVPIPLRATITCNGTSASSDSNGTYSLAVPESSDYTCTATAPKYSSVTAHFAEGNAFTLNFGPKSADQCAANNANTTLTCDVLPPARATLRGTVTNASTDKAIPRVEVQCWNAASDFNTNGGSPLVSAITDEMGNYALHNLPVDPFACVADTDQTLQYAVLKPGAETTLDLPVCASKCPTLGFHNGTVMHHLTVYLDFWLPSGYTFEPNGSSSRFEQLMAQYFQDVGGTPFYNILTQYYDGPGGPVRNTVTYGGSYVDTRNYPHAGTQWDPLYDSDIRDEITHVIGVKPTWTADSDHLFLVFTGYNVQECSGHEASDGCTFTHNNEGDFCAYHSLAPLRDAYYAYMPVVDGCLDLPSAQSPNHDTIADAIISIASHEQFETVSDPKLGGWFDYSTREGEIGDKCVGIYGSIGTDGGNVTLAHGHRYIVQEEWSLHDQECALSFTALPTI
jgi:hypothetical protein